MPFLLFKKIDIFQSLMNNGKELEIELLVNYLPIVQKIIAVILFITSLLFYVRFILVLRNHVRRDRFVSQRIGQTHEITFPSIISDKKDFDKIVVV